jgi:hypothetical protein
MDIELSSDAEQFLVEKKNISGLLIDICKIDEGCTRIYNPTIEILENGKNPEKKEINIKQEKEKYSLFVTQCFSEIYGGLKKLKIHVGGLFEKMLILENIEARTKNICKV